MKILPLPIRALVVCLLTVSLSHVAEAWASQSQLAPATEMVSTVDWVDGQTREQLTKNIVDFIHKDDVRAQLLAQGVSTEEASERIAALSQTELEDLSKQIEHAQYGGNILVAILIVVLIIFLIKRI